MDHATQARVIQRLQAVLLIALGWAVAEVTRPEKRALIRSLKRMPAGAVLVIVDATTLRSLGRAVSSGSIACGYCATC
jgi:hypothetical protein